MASFNFQNTLTQGQMFLVRVGELNGRIDPIQFHTERKNIIEKLKKIPTVKLAHAVSLKNNTVKESDDIYIGLENIESDTGIYVSTQEKNTFSSAHAFKKGNIIFPKLRPYLNKVYLAEFDGVCSTEFHILQANPEYLNDFLAIYLRSNLIVGQTKWLMTGNTLPRLQTSDILNLQVPVLSLQRQQEIVKLYNSAFSNRLKRYEQAQTLLNSINTYLLGELKITLPQTNNCLESRIFSVQMRKVSGGRFDPFLHKQYFQQLEQNLKTTSDSYLPLSYYVLGSCGGQWGSDISESYDKNQQTECLVIRATEFDNEGNLFFNPEKIKYRLIDNKKLNTMNIKENDILIEKSGGSENQPVGRVAILTKEILEAYPRIAYSNFVHKISIDGQKIMPEYLFHYLKLLHNIKFTEKMQSQTNGIRNLILSEFNDIPIVTISREKQKEIITHIRQIRQQASDLRKQADEQFAKAKVEIEQMILGVKQ